MKNVFNLLFTAALLLAATLCRAQPRKPPGMHFRTLHYYTYGLQAFPDEPSPCYKDIQKRYCIVYKVKAGCVLRPGQQLRYQLHNARIDKKQRRRFGDDWYEQYRKALAACGSQT